MPCSISISRISTVALIALISLGAGIGLAACGHETRQTAAQKSQTTADELRATLSQTVKDPVRLQQMLSVSDQLARDLKAGMVELELLLAEQDRLNRAYATTPAALDEIWIRIQATRQTYRTRLLHARSTLAQLATDDEWKQIIDHDHPVLGN
jgi:hypothetical protein